MLRHMAYSLLVLGLPLVVLVLGGKLMSSLADRAQVRRALNASDLQATDRLPLNLRVKGYDVTAVVRHWRPIKADARADAAERAFLRLDLIFPLAYGAALVASLLIAWRLLGRPLPIAVLISPVVAAMVADWIENTIQIRQLASYIPGDESSLDGAAIHLASAATTVKIVLLGALSVGVIAAAAAVLWQGLESRVS